MYCETVPTHVCSFRFVIGALFAYIRTNMREVVATISIIHTCCRGGGYTGTVYVNCECLYMCGVRTHDITDDFIKRVCKSFTSPLYRNVIHNELIHSRSNADIQQTLHHYISWYIQNGSSCTVKQIPHTFLVYD
jgi:hypothetical protein